MNRHLVALGVALPLLFGIGAAIYYLKAPTVSMTYEVVAVHGDVEIDGKPAADVSDFQEAAGARITTGRDGLVSIRLEDGSIVQIYPESDLQVNSAKRDRLHSRFDTELQLNRGEILRRVPEGDDTVRNADLTTNSANIGVRGTEFKVVSGVDGTQVTVTRGKVAVGDSTGQELTLGANYGVRVEKDGGLQDAIVLLPPPNLEEPSRGFQLREAPVDLKWSHVDGAVEYLVEIASSADFVHLVAQQRTPFIRASFNSLPYDAPMYWRVSSINEQDLQGRPAEARVLHYRPYFQKLREIRDQSALAEELLPLIPLALRGYPTDAPANKAAAWTYYLNGQLDRARAAYDQALAIESGDMEARIERARTAFWQGDLNQAEQDYLHVLETSPEDPDALWGLADVRHAQGRHPEAIELASKSLSVLPANVDALLVLARAHAKVGHWTSVEQVTGQILSIDPEHQPAIDLQRQATARR